MAILDEIQAERGRQDAKWGGAKHDDEHSNLEWCYLIDGYLDKSITTAVYGVPPSGETWRTRMIQIAALAVAAIESHDRKHPVRELVAPSIRCPHGHPACCGHHDTEDMPVHADRDCAGRGA